MQLDQAFINAIQPVFEEIWERCDQSIILGDESPETMDEEDREEMNAAAIDFVRESYDFHDNEEAFVDEKALIAQAEEQHGSNVVYRFIQDNIKLLY